MKSQSYLNYTLWFLIVAVFVVSPAVGHQIQSETTGTETASVPNVESCATFTWTKKTSCSTYDTTNHHWEVINNCPRGVKVKWADNAHNRPIRRGEKSRKPRLESSTSLRSGGKLKRSVNCVDKAEIEMCVEYTYPPLREHDKNCEEFFD